jgi:MoaA/NifB/PqqE/SkfB family radical SAM enzyme
MGCIMEPTLDTRMADLLLDVRGSRAAPTKELTLQTNGILLHMHEAHKLSDAGLTRLALSIDSADAAVQRSLRGGTSLGKVERNLRAFVAACPRAQVHFVTTVTRLNIDSLEGLVTFGLDVGVSMFVLREVFYHPELDVPVDRARVPDLVLRPGDYARMAARLSETFRGRASFDFADSARLATGESKMIVDSLREGE